MGTEQLWSCNEKNAIFENQSFRKNVKSIQTRAETRRKKGLVLCALGAGTRIGLMQTF